MNSTDPIFTAQMMDGPMPMGLAMLIGMIIGILIIILLVVLIIRSLRR